VPTPYANKTPYQRSLAHAATKRWAEKNRAKKAEYRRKHYMENREKYLTIERERSYRKLYGIGIVDYDRMLAEQGGKCAICDSPEALPGKADRFFSVDHCHNTGKVRGLLCVACNHLLGRFEKHEQAISRYLNRS
jgi:hypothetical protein